MNLIFQKSSTDGLGESVIIIYQSWTIFIKKSMTQSTVSTYVEPSTHQLLWSSKADELGILQRLQSRSTSKTCIISLFTFQKLIHYWHRRWISNFGPLSQCLQQSNLRKRQVFSGLRPFFVRLLKFFYSTIFFLNPHRYNQLIFIDLEITGILFHFDHFDP